MLIVGQFTYKIDACIYENPSSIQAQKAIKWYAMIIYFTCLFEFRFKCLFTKSKCMMRQKYKHWRSFDDECFACLKKLMQFICLFKMVMHFDVVYVYHVKINQSVFKVPTHGWIIADFVWCLKIPLKLNSHRIRPNVIVI